MLHIDFLSGVNCCTFEIDYLHVFAFYPWTHLGQHCKLQNFPLFVSFDHLNQFLSLQVASALILWRGNCISKNDLEFLLNSRLTSSRGPLSNRQCINSGIVHTFDRHRRKLILEGASPLAFSNDAEFLLFCFIIFSFLHSLQYTTTWTVYTRTNGTNRKMIRSSSLNSIQQKRWILEWTITIH